MDHPDAVVVRSERRFSQAVGALNAYTDHECSEEILVAEHSGGNRWYAWYSSEATDILLVAAGGGPDSLLDMPQSIEAVDAGDMLELASGWPCCKEVGA